MQIVVIGTSAAAANRADHLLWPLDARHVQCVAAVEFAPLERIDEISRRPLLGEMEDLAPAGLEAVQHR